MKKFILKYIISVFVILIFPVTATSLIYWNGNCKIVWDCDNNNIPTNENIGSNTGKNEDDNDDNGDIVLPILPA